MTPNKPVELGQKPTLTKSFEDVSDAHRRARETVEQAVDAISVGDDPTPPSIRGPLRSGKTALQYHMFDYAWEQGVPALYVEASTLLGQFRQSESESFGDWIDEQAQAQVAALENGTLDQVEWLPNDTPTNLQAWFDGISSTTTKRVVLLVDEVEQKYTEFLSATGVDDNNPLRKLLDQGQLFPVLSMGQISAMQFVGFADMKRTDPVSIPPVTISHIRALLEERDLDPALDRVVFWLTRGRAAHVHQVVTDARRNDVSFDDRVGLTRWLASLADERSSEFRTVRRIWEHPNVADPETAAASVAFDEDGHADWLVKSETWRPADELVGVIETIVLEADAFTTQDGEADAILEARQIVRESIERVVDGIAVGSSIGPSDTCAAVPTGWLTGHQDDRSEGRAFLSLVQDILLAFEAERPARNIAFDALEDAKERFKQQYDAKVATTAATPGDAWTLRPSMLEEIYPPLATDPSRLTGRQTEELVEAWDTEGHGGLELSVDAPATVYACPTEASLRIQLERLSADPTHPVVVLADDIVDVEGVLESAPLARALKEHSALSVVPVPTARVWTFVVQLSALLGEELDDAHTATEERISDLLAADLRREQRTTIKTLYSHLTTRVAGEAAEAAVKAHRQQFTIEEHYVWAHPNLAGTSFLSPRGGPTGGRHSVLGLLALGCEPNWDAPHGKLLATIRAGLDEDIIDNKGSFGYKELLNHLTSSGEYGKAIHDPRRVCRDDSGTTPKGAVTRATNAFEAVIQASETDGPALLSGLYAQESAHKGPEATHIQEFVTALSPTETDDTTDDVLLALVTTSLARGDTSYVTATLADVADTFDEHVQTLDGYLSDVERAQEILSPAGTGAASGTITGEFDALSRDLGQQSQQPDTETDGPQPDADPTVARGALGITLDTSHLTTYRESLVAVRDAVRDAKQCATKTDFRPTGYALAVLAARYEDEVRDAVHELERSTPSDGDLNQVKNLSSTVGALRSLLDDDDVELSDAERAGVGAFVRDLLDFHQIAGSRITVGDPHGGSMGVINDVNRAAQVRTYQVEDLVTDLEALVDLKRDVARRLTDTHRLLQALVMTLATPEANINIDDGGPPHAETLLGDGQGGETDASGDNQQANANDTTEDQE